MFSFRACLRLCSRPRSKVKNMERCESTKLTQSESSRSTEFSIAQYDAIGFDLDHTIGRYNLKPLFHLIYNTLASFLIQEYDYPKDLATINESDLSFAQKGLILDKKRGNFLKLDAQHRIVRASHGTHMLDPEEIRKRYGRDRTWKEAVNGIPQKLVLKSALEEPFYVFKDYFVTPGAAICAKMVDLLDAEGGELTEYSFWDHYLHCLLLMYERQNFEDNKGGFFPAMRAQPELYLQSCPDSVKKWLDNIHGQKVTFLVTSANYDAAAFTAEHCLGKDWKKYFDLVITFAGKPGFFWDSRPFCLVKDGTEESGVKLSEGSHLFSQGNFKELREKCAQLSQTKQPKIVYFGDSLIEDVYAASELAGCDVVAIVEELLTENSSLTEPNWGSFFGDSQEGQSLWGHLLFQHSKLTIPHLEMLSTINLKEKLQCTPNSRCIPDIPKVLLN